MAFSTTIFLFFFFPISALLYYVSVGLEDHSDLIKRLRIKDIILILLSIVFYSFTDLFNIIRIISYILLTYFISFFIQKIRSRKKAPFLAAGILIAVSALFYYKYFSYIVSSFSMAEAASFEAIAAPLGISFIVFSSISYIVDNYKSSRRNLNFLDAALYISFFPKIISGPIVLWRDFEPQLKTRSIGIDKLVSGINRIVIGLAEKVIFADSFGALVSEIQSQSDNGITVSAAWFCVFLYTLQIYFDFSGYSSMAIGLSELFGFSFAENFNFPYISTSITDFWRRWHISLGTWFREYLYIPLGGNRKGKVRTLINLIIVFLTTGIWHGAGICYLAWGAMHGVCMITERLIKNTAFYKKIPSLIKWLGTMIVVSMGWIVFMYSDPESLLGFYDILFGIKTSGTVFAGLSYYLTPKILTLILIAMLGAALPIIKPFTVIKEKFSGSKSFFIVGETAILLVFVISIMFVVNSTYAPFIYFQY